MFPCYLKTPAPKRGEIVRQIGQALRDNLENLGKLVSYNIICLTYTVELCTNICFIVVIWIRTLENFHVGVIFFSREERKRSMTIQK